MSANIKNENIDLTSILKDVENCIRSGLSNKLDTFFYEYDKYKKTHEEVLNLSIVKELLKNSSSTPSHSSEDTKPKLDPELEMIVLRNQIIYLRTELDKYKNNLEEQSQRQTKIVTINPEYSHINLEVKEEEREPLDIKSENEDEYGDGDGDVSITSDSSDTSDSSNSSDSDIIEDNIQNIVLNVTEKDERNNETEDQCEAEVEAEVEVDSDDEEGEVKVKAEHNEEEEEEEEDEDEDEDEDEEEDEDTVVKMPTFPTKKVDEVKSVIEETKTEEPTDEEDDEDEEQDAIDPEYDVETENEEDSDQEQVTEPISDTKTLEVKVETETETETDLAQNEEENEEEEEEEELYEVEINGVMYVTNDDEDGTIYSYINEEVGDKVGEFKGLVAHVYNGKNKGIYDRTKCKLNF